MSTTATIPGLTRESTADEKLAVILAATARGATVYLTTYTGATKITAKVVAKFAAINHPVLKSDGKDLWLTSGRRYVCASLCGIVIQG